MEMKEKVLKESSVEKVPRSPLGPFQPSFVCTMTLGDKQTSFARSCSKGPVPFDVDEEDFNTLFALDSHPKAIDMSRVQLVLGGKIFHGAGPALAFTRRGGHQRRTYLSSNR